MGNPLVVDAVVSDITDLNSIQIGIEYDVHERDPLAGPTTLGAAISSLHGAPSFAYDSPTMGSMRVLANFVPRGRSVAVFCVDDFGAFVVVLTCGNARYLEFRPGYNRVHILACGNDADGLCLDAYCNEVLEDVGVITELRVHEEQWIRRINMAYRDVISEYKNDYKPLHGDPVSWLLTTGLFAMPWSRDYA